METKQLETAISSAILEQEITLPEGRKEELFDNIYQNIINKKEEFVTLQSRINQKTRPRYYLHYKGRKKGLNIQTKERRVSVISTQVEVIKNNKYAVALSEEYGYNLQLTID
ncbi:MAG: hypothetical protein GX568_06600 [Candidatus Gastranaerophilales bacterium]|nr:hypothetical protein [Candidatus Gastranaerophilales bacterium]